MHWSHSEAEAQRVAEQLQAPFGTTPSHKGLISEEHPLALGVLGFGSFPFANGVCQESDVILAVGTTMSEALTAGYGNRVIPAGAKLIHIDLDPAELGKSYAADVGIVGDARQALTEIRARLPTQPNAAAAARATATRVGLPFVILVVHNDAYGNMKRDQIRHYGGRVIGTELNVPDLVQLGGAFGAYAERVERPAELPDAMRRAFAANKTALLDVICPIEGI